MVNQVSSLLEMELKRKYREVPSKEEGSLEIKQNNWFRRNLLSLTGWYYFVRVDVSEEFSFLVTKLSLFLNDKFIIFYLH
jgi:hypothetical protein